MMKLWVGFTARGAVLSGLLLSGGLAFGQVWFDAIWAESLCVTYEAVRRADPETDPDLDGIPYDLTFRICDLEPGKAYRIAFDGLPFNRWSSAEGCVAVTFQTVLPEGPLRLPLEIHDVGRHHRAVLELTDHPKCVEADPAARFRRSRQ